MPRTIGAIDRRRRLARMVTAGVLVYRLGHGPLKAERRVRFPCALPISIWSNDTNDFSRFKIFPARSMSQSLDTVEFKSLFELPSDHDKTDGWQFQRFKM